MFACLYWQAVGLSCRRCTLALGLRFSSGPGDLLIRAWLLARHAHARPLYSSRSGDFSFFLCECQRVLLLEGNLSRSLKGETASKGPAELWDDRPFLLRTVMKLEGKGMGGSERLELLAGSLEWISV